MEKIKEIRFAIIGMVVILLFSILVEIFLWVKYVPIYNSLFIQAYGVSLTPQVLRFFGIALLVLTVIGFILSWISAKAYNVLLKVRIK